jgi:hypothetical protein
MKFLKLSPLFLSLLLVLAGCQGRRHSNEPQGGFVAPPDNQEAAATDPAVDPAPVAPPQVEETPPPAPPKLGNYEYAKTVPGKPGYVTLPSSPKSGYIDVKGFAPGDLARDPLTQRIFVVP